jgi:hypothetical protein
VRVVEHDRRSLSALDWIVVGTAAAAIASLFLPWYGVEYLGVGDVVAGYATGFGCVGALLIGAAGVLLLVTRTDSLVASVPMLAMSALGAALVTVRALTIGSLYVGPGTSLSYGTRVGIVVALLAGIVQTVGAGMLVARGSDESPQSTTN